MAEITTELIKHQVDQTSVSVMQCKKALEEAEGDIASTPYSEKKSAEIAAKKSDREALSGLLVGKKI